MAAAIIALTLGKAMGSAGRAMNWAVLMTSSINKMANMTVKPDTKMHPILSKIPLSKIGASWTPLSSWWMSTRRGL